jgi:uncharacterized protein YraI
MRRLIKATLLTTLITITCFQATELEAAAPKPAMRFDSAYSGNYSRRSSRSIRRIVIHTIEGSEAGAIGWFKNPQAKVSAHYIVAKSGRITQMVKDNDIAWHVRGNNSDTIGIENEGYAGQNGWTNAQYDALARLSRYLCDRYNIQISRKYIVGHYELDPARRTDPGRYFDWSGYLTRTRNVGSSSPQPTPTPPATPAPTATPTTSSAYGVEITASVLNVRSAVWGRVLGQIYKGQRFVVKSQSSGWYQIYYRNTRAWVSGKYARRITGDAAKIKVSSLNVRTGPSTGYRRIGSTPNGQIHYIQGSNGSWLKIHYDSRNGWFHGFYVERVRLR